MKSLDRLVAEHDLIEQGLNLLEKVAQQIRDGQPVQKDFPRWAAEFFREFADRCHHAKEEDLLFPLLQQRGIPRQGGPIGVMLHEHEVGRDCVRRMRQAADADDLDTESFALAAAELLPLLREHIFKENNILYRMAANVMSDADDAELITRFSQAEQERELDGMEERFREQMQDWQQRLR